MYLATIDSAGYIIKLIPCTLLEYRDMPINPHEVFIAHDAFLNANMHKTFLATPESFRIENNELVMDMFYNNV